MNTTVFAFQQALKKKAERGWDKIYVAIDVHETILHPNYEGVSDEYYPEARKCLQEMSSHDDIVLIMWTCSTKEHRDAYWDLFKADGIHFDHTNENGEVSGVTEHADYDTKMYVNVIMDDKANPSVSLEWANLLLFLKKKKLNENKT